MTQIKPRGFLGFYFQFSRILNLEILNQSNKNMIQNKDTKVIEKQVIEKLQHYLALREHSPTELERKLIKHFDKQSVKKAITLALNKKWLTEPKTLAERWALTLHKKKRGWLFIQADLKKRGLPLIQKQEDLEIEKALWWLEKKFSQASKTQKDLLKIKRFLSYRGFDGATIQQALTAHKNST